MSSERCMLDLAVLNATDAGRFQTGTTAASDNLWTVAYKEWMRIRLCVCDEGLKIADYSVA